MFNVWMTCPACPSKRTFDVGQAGPSSGYLLLGGRATTSTLDRGLRPAHTLQLSFDASILRLDMVDPLDWSTGRAGVPAITCPLESWSPGAGALPFVHPLGHGLCIYANYYNNSY